MIQLFYIENGTAIELTKYTGNYSTSDNIDSLGMALSFDLVCNPYDDYLRDTELAIGGKVLFKENGKTIFEGVIIKYSRNSLATLTYYCYDYGFYLNKSEAMIQFNNISVTDALNRLCKENEIPVGSITQINTLVTKLYSGAKISDIIKDLLKLGSNETGSKYRLEVRENKLYIDKYEDLVITARYKPASNMEAFDATGIVGSFSSEYSIENMANKVMVIASSEKHAPIYGVVEDSEAIKKYGLLVKIEKVEDKKKSQAVAIAKKQLEKLDKITKSFRVTLFGDSSVRSGRMLKFNQPDINLVGTYLVKNCTHSYTGNLHTMDLDLTLEAYSNE